MVDRDVTYGTNDEIGPDLTLEDLRRVAEMVIETDGITTRVRCVCGQPIEYHDKYCRECGRMQVWTGRK